MLLLIGSAIVLIWEKPSETTSESLAFIPTDAGILIEASKPQSLYEKLNNNKVWQEIMTIEACQSTNSFLYQIDTTIRNNAGYTNWINRLKISISLHPHGPDNFSTLYTVALNKQIGDKEAVEIIKEHIPDYEIKKYDGIPIYSYDTESHKIYFCVTQGIALLSQSGILIEKAVRQSQTKHNLLEDQSFSQIRKTTGANTDANLFIHPERAGRLLSGLSKNRLRSLTSQIGEFSSWMALDLSSRQDFLLFNGFSHTDESLQDYLSILQQHKPKTIRSTQAIPASTQLAVILTFNSFEQYLEDYKNHLSSHDKLNSYLERIGQINQQYNMDIEKDLAVFINREISFMKTDMRGIPADENQFILLETTSQSLAKKMLTQYTHQHAVLNKAKLSKFQSNYTIDKESSFSLSLFPEPTIFHTLFGEVYSLSNKELWYTFLDQYVLFGTSKKAIAAYIHNYILRRSLLTHYGYKDISEYAVEQANLMVYADLRSLADNNKAFLSKKTSSALNKTPSIANIQSLLLEINATDEYLYHNLVIHHSTEEHITAKTEWECLLDAPVNIKPAVVINHQTNEREVFVQDKHNNIYLINKAGRILWKIPIDAPIMSDIYQIDFYKNNKLQLLFNTKDKIYLIDRNGNAVENYPIQLRSQASAPLSLFDYENNKKYRFFIACKDRSIYCYNKEGRLVQGWQFNKSETPVTHPIQHFRIGTRDYIFISDQYNSYILNRRGETRIKTEKPTSPAKNSSVFLQPGQSPHFILTDKAGKTISIDLNGKVREEKKATISPAHYFLLEDINGNDKKEFIYTDKANVMVYKDNSAPLFTKEIAHTPTARPIFFHFGEEDRKLGLLCGEDNKIYLLNNDGSLYRGFPLKGFTPFSITRFKPNSSQFNLLVGGDGNFLYNYVLQ